MHKQDEDQSNKAGKPTIHTHTLKRVPIQWNYSSLSGQHQYMHKMSAVFIREEACILRKKNHKN